MNKEKNGTFAERHPRINLLIGLVFLLLILLFIIWVMYKVLILVSFGFNEIIIFLKSFVSNTDKLIVVAMITATVSIFSVLMTSIVAKIIEYKYNVKKYLYNKRKEPYEQFIYMIYKIMEDTKKSNNDKMPEEELTKMVLEFSKGLTLWGSNNVVKKWLKYRKNSIDGSNNNSLILLEDIIYQIRKDVGLGKKLKKGDMLSIFINDIKSFIKK